MTRAKEGKWSGEIWVNNRQKKTPVHSGQIKRAAKKILAFLGYQGYELSIVIVDDPEISRLNRQYFRRNRPTNVISFPMNDGGAATPPAGVLGDLIISAETARRQAEEAGRKGEEEILFLLIHGILHLVGYDHEGLAEKRRKMEAKERELFSLLLRARPRKPPVPKTR